MKIDISDSEGQELVKILEKQIEKTSWVIENKSPENEEFLQKRVDLMSDVIKQIKQASGMEVATDEDSLDIEGI